MRWLKRGIEKTKLAQAEKGCQPYKIGRKKRSEPISLKPERPLSLINRKPWDKRARAVFLRNTPPLSLVALPFHYTGSTNLNIR